MTVELNISDTNAPETTALLRWVEKEKENGLIDIKFLKKNTDNSTVESFCAEVNQMLRAPSVSDPDLF